MIVIQSSKTLKDAYTGKTTAIDYVPITNSGTKSVDAYLHVHYDNTLETYGVSIATTYSGVYIGIEDSIFIAGNSNYNIGVDAAFDNTEIDSNGRLVISDQGLKRGVYVSQVIPVSNRNLISTFISDYDTPSGTHIALYYRCSNKEPIPIEEIWWRASEKLSIDTFETTAFTSWGLTPYATCFDPINGRVIVSSSSYLRSFDISTGTPYIIRTAANVKYNFDHRMRIDKSGYVWGYNGTSLLKLDGDLNIVMELERPVEDSIHDFAPTTSISGSFWYTDTISNSAVCSDIEGNRLFSAFLYEPRAICSTDDGGCWAIDNKFKKAFRYSKTFVLIKELQLPEKKVYTATEDGNNGFWYSTSSRVIHVDSQGRELVNIYANDVDRILIGRKKTMLYSDKSESVFIIKTSTGEILNKIKYKDKNYRNIPAFLTLGFENRLDHSYISFPLSYDPVWAHAGSPLAWKPATNGTVVDKAAYYQFKVSLSVVSGTLGYNYPSLTRIGLTKGVRVDSILPGETRNIYIKNEPLYTLPEASYNFNLNCTWKSING